MLARAFGPGALLAKADIQSAFRLLPIHPSGFNSLRFQFDKMFFVDKFLPMGCSLSFFYFEAFTTFLEWVVSCVGRAGGVVHYLDDFLFVGPSLSPVCEWLLRCFISICSDFGVPLAQEKNVGPSKCLEYLDIVIDTVACEFRLTMEKINRCCEMLTRLLRVKKESILGLLAFVSWVMPMGNKFVDELRLR